MQRSRAKRPVSDLRRLGRDRAAEREDREPRQRPDQTERFFHARRVGAAVGLVEERGVRLLGGKPSDRIFRRPPQKDDPADLGACVGVDPVLSAVGRSVNGDLLVGNVKQRLIVVDHRDPFAEALAPKAGMRGLPRAARGGEKVRPPPDRERGAVEQKNVPIEQPFADLSVHGKAFEVVGGEFSAAVFVLRNVLAGNVRLGHENFRLGGRVGAIIIAELFGKGVSAVNAENVLREAQMKCRGDPLLFLFYRCTFFIFYHGRGWVVKRVGGKGGFGSETAVLSEKKPRPFGKPKGRGLP